MAVTDRDELREVQCQCRSCKTGPECHRNAYTGTLSADARLAAHPTRSLGVI